MAGSVERRGAWLWSRHFALAAGRRKSLPPPTKTTPDPFFSSQYTWDFGNRLTQVVIKTSAGVTVTNDVFTYDVEDRRIGKSVNGTQQWFAYDGKNTYVDFDSTGALTMLYLSGSAVDSLYARFNGTTTSWYLTDNIGSVRKIVNTTGTTLDALTYDSYGNVLSETSPTNGDRFKYTRRELDSEIGLQYNRARSYSAVVGRWTRQDPLGFPAGDFNLYRYVANQPLLYVDALGTHKGDRWFGMDNRDFQRWFHRFFKPSNPQEGSQTDKDYISEAYAEWLASGKPDGEGHATELHFTTINTVYGWIQAHYWHIATVVAVAVVVTAAILVAPYITPYVVYGVFVVAC
jgi:RHS repeat-associated protein